MLTDDELIEGFESGTLGQFPHASHVRLSLIYLSRHGVEGARAKLAQGLLSFATRKGHPEKFHVTLTDAWLTLLDSARRRHPDATTPEALVAACPQLLDKDALDRFYSRPRLTSEAARVAWLPPDLTAEIDASLLEIPDDGTRK